MKFNKIAGITLLNTATAGINFISNYFIVQWLSLSVFGEFAVYNSYVTFGTLLYSVIPSNYSIFKFQDEKDFRPLLFSFFIISSIIFTLYLAALNLLGLIYISLWSSVFYSLPLAFQSYFDISLQATNKLKLYFSILFVISLIKILLLFLFFQIGVLRTFENLVILSAIPQSIIIGLLCLKELNGIKVNKSKIYNPVSVINYIIVNLKSFYPYYLNTILKRTRENSIVLLFSRIVSYDIMGAFALFFKVASFVFGLSRTLESFFMNRENFKVRQHSQNHDLIYFAFVLQIIYLTVGTIYLKSLTNSFFFFETFFQSLLVYPHIFFLQARVEMLSKFKNKESNASEALYTSIVLIAFILSLVFHLTSIYIMLITFTMATFSLQLYMIVSTKMQKKKLI